MIECLTDNKNRAVKALRNKFNRMEGSMTSVGYMFEMKGCIWFTAGETGDSEDTMFEKAIEAGAEDIAELGDGRFEVTCEFNKLRIVTQQLSECSGYTIERMAGAYISTTSVDVNEEQAQELLAIIDDLEELDDVVKVYSNMA
ncbi:hypothetical protein LPJ66_006819 [Kickxella alabastrina]|uniref:Uncharacterized protein n=1 Tax=Kickxella alabastrina TaxID=61397 RepID=A0ACC1IBA8_9FUNG|nr:hypothetical protein LPJ66_006819 [Kickxella alabastrina]